MDTTTIAMGNHGALDHHFPFSPWIPSASCHDFLHVGETHLVTKKSHKKVIHPRLNKFMFRCVFFQRKSRFALIPDANHGSRNIGTYIETPKIHTAQSFLGKYSIPPWFVSGSEKPSIFGLVLLKWPLMTMVRIWEWSIFEHTFIDHDVMDIPGPDRSGAPRPRKKNRSLPPAQRPSAFEPPCMRRWSLFDGAKLSRF